MAGNAAQGELFEPRETRVLPEHLNDLKQTIHEQHGSIDHIAEDGVWRVVTWREGIDPYLPRTDAPARSNRCPACGEPPALCKC